ncbi:hypothetical protein Droror1_Dr00016135 [Drosera rotundifolia]
MFDQVSLLPSPRLPRRIPIPIHPSLNLIGGSFLCEELLTQSQSTHRSSPFPGQISLLLHPIHSQSRTTPNTHHHFPITIAHPSFFNNSIDPSRHPHFHFLPFGKSTNGGEKPVVAVADELGLKSVGLRTGGATSLLSLREAAKDAEAGHTSHDSRVTTEGLRLTVDAGQRVMLLFVVCELRICDTAGGTSSVRLCLWELGLSMPHEVQIEVFSIQLLTKDVETLSSAAVANTNHGGVKVADNEMRKMLIDAFVDNATLRKQINSLIRCSLRTSE